MFLQTYRDLSDSHSHIFCSCTNICYVLKFYFFFSCWKKAAPSIPAWGAPCRRGSYEAKPDSRQSGSTHCLLSLLCNQPFAWGKEKGTLTRKGHLSKNHCHMTPNTYISLHPNPKGLGWNLNGVSQIINAAKCSGFCGFQSIYVWGPVQWRGEIGGLTRCRRYLVTHPSPAQDSS